ncbi:hypothetical protein ACHAXT_003092 [Thalassiosira profunda]
MNEATHSRECNACADVPETVSFKPPRKEDFPPQSKSWCNALKDILASVETGSENNPVVFFKSDKYVCTYDKFPKARHHLLLMCRQRQLNGGLSAVQTLNDIQPKHLDELREFHTLGRKIVSRLENNASNGRSVTMKLGYHAIPSLEPLHLHIISSDVDSPCVKTRKHVVSFTSPTFFVSPESLERHLKGAFVENLRVHVRPERAEHVLKYTPMACVRCGMEAATVPAWKDHNEFCRMPLPGGEDRSKLNSLLGWISTAVPGNKSNGSGVKRKRDELGEEIDGIY